MAKINKVWKRQKWWGCATGGGVRLKWLRVCMRAALTTLTLAEVVLYFADIAVVLNLVYKKLQVFYLVA